MADRDTEIASGISRGIIAALKYEADQAVTTGKSDVNAATLRAMAAQTKALLMIAERMDDLVRLYAENVRL